MSAPSKKISLSTQLDNLHKSVTGKESGELKINIFSKRPTNFEIMSFGIPEIDRASNCGGHARGSTIELYGLESGGKTYTAIKTMAAYQKAGLRAALLDVEHSFVPEWGEKQGIDLSQLLYGEDFIHGEQALQYMCDMCMQHIADIIVLDSTAGLLPKAEVEAKFEDNVMALQARMLSRAIKRIMDEAWKSKTTCLFVNQIRVKPGVSFGNPEETPGGKALKFYSHQRLDVRRVGVETTTENGQKKPIGITSKVKFVKNRFAAPFGEGDFLIYFDPALSTPIVKLVQLAAQYRVIPRRKKVDDQMRYFWDDGKDSEDTGCVSLFDFSEWIELNGHSVLLLDMVEAKAKEKGEVVPDDICQLRNSKKADDASSEDEAKDASKK